MKQGKRLTRDQKIMLSRAGWDHKAYLCVRDMPNTLILTRKADGELVIFDKYVGEKPKRRW